MTLLEVTVAWGTQVLSVGHVEVRQGFTIGDGGDLVVPNVPKTAIDVHADTRLSLEVEGLAIDVVAVAPSAQPSRGILAACANGATAAIALSFVGHITLLGTMASFMPPPRTDEIPREQLLAMMTLMDAASERADEPEPIRSATLGSDLVSTSEEVELWQAERDDADALARTTPARTGVVTGASLMIVGAAGIAFSLQGAGASAALTYSVMCTNQK